MIELQNFSKNYRSLFSKQPLFSVSNINFKIQKGEILGLLGPNGSGKTTIIKALCGFHYPDEGQIILGDENNFYNITEDSKIAMEIVGYVPEKSILPADLFVKEFLDYCAESHGISGNDKKIAVERVINECSIEDVLNKKIKELSKGYQQRVSFAQAIIHNPPNIILDEPASGLDPAQIIQMRTLIKKMAETKSVLMSTHLLQEVYSLCTKICVISNGKMTAYGTESEIVEKCKTKNLEDAFLKLTSNSTEMGD